MAGYAPRRGNCWLRHAWLSRAAAIVVTITTTAAAQAPSPGTTPLVDLRLQDVAAGSPAERTLRALELLGSRPLSVQSDRFSAGRESLLAAASRGTPIARETPAPIAWDRPTLRIWVNSARSRQDRDGPVWQGRGVTAAANAGVIGSWRWLDVVVRPMAFVSQNAPFTPSPSAPVDGAFRHPAWGGFIDLPYRMGPRAYAMWDPGESHVRFGNRIVAVGLSTATERWGPADRFPLLMGTEGGGFPRAFVSGNELPIGVGRLQARWMFGMLETSSYSGLNPAERSAVGSGLAVSFVPRWLNSLEIGGGRFFHVRRHARSVPWESATWPFSGVLKKSTAADRSGSANQLASVFARLVPMGAGVELYGEFLREDHNVDLRDLLGEPDHIGAYTIGVKRSWRAGPDVLALTIERANGRISHLERVRDQGPTQLHGILLEGHTHRGQPLGNSAVIGGGGIYVAVNRIGARRTQYAELEFLAGPQSAEGGAWNGKSYGETRLGVGSRPVSGRFRIGWEAAVRLGHGQGSWVNLEVAAQVR